jgi:hypothetical protein
VSVAQAYRRPGAARLAMVCDSCAAALVGPAYVRSSWPDLWRRATRRGWSGSRLPTGPHTCASCNAQAT